MPKRLLPVLGLMADDKVRVATVTLVLALCARWGLDGVQTSQVTAIIIGIFALGTAVVGSLGYERGKNLEGSVPPGRIPANGTQINVGTGMDSATTDIIPVAVPVAGDPIKAVPVAVGVGPVVVPPAGMPEGTPVGGILNPDPAAAMKPGSIPKAASTALLLIGCFVGLLMSGCHKGGSGAGNLPSPFAWAVRHGFEQVSDELKGYADAQPWTNDAAGEHKRQELDAAGELRLAILEPAHADYHRCKRAWDTARPLYLARVNADPKLTPPDRQTLLDMVAAVDRVLVAEGRVRGPPR